MEKRTLRIALAINAGMFLAESGGGYLADSSALIADSLDMFADAAVYAISLYGAGQALGGQRKAARLSGWLHWPSPVVRYSRSHAGPLLAASRNRR